MKRYPIVISLLAALGALGLLLVGLPAPARSQSPVEYIVAPDGLYASPGTLAAPTTLEGARDKIRALETLPVGGVIVSLRGGTYTLTRTFALGVQDSGAITAPVVYRAYMSEPVRLSGGTALDPAWFAPASGTLLDRLPEAARPHVQQVSLPAHGITDYGALTRRGFSVYSPMSALELAFNDEMMELARWPNRGQTDAFNVSAPATVTGVLTPNVAGSYEYIGSEASGSADDGYPNYRRVGLVDGVQYYLYHCTWVYGTTHPKYWFISPYSPLDDPHCWPTASNSWQAQSDRLYPFPPMVPLANAEGTALIRTQPEDYVQDGFLRIPEALSNTQFRFPGSRYQGWSQDNDFWFQGLFKYYWADDSLPGTLDGGGVVTLADETSYGISAGRPFFALNVVEELDTPGEWYLDRETGVLYFWPPSDLNGSNIAVSLLADPLMTLNRVAHIRFEALTFEMGRKTLVAVNDGDSVRFNDCTFRNSGAYGLTVEGANNRIEDSRIYNTGAGGVLLSGGDRPSLTNGNNAVANSEIHHFGRWDRTYKPAVLIYGVGNVVEHCEIHDAPHTAILLHGNEHRIAYNEIANVVQEAGDAGAIYTGRDWGYRGVRIAYNFIHHIHSVFGDSNAVYLDDAVSGIEVYGNILYEVWGQATLSGGGRDNLFRNNIMVNANGAHYTDRRARTANHNYNGDRPDSWNLLGRINMDYTDYSGVVPIDYQHGVWAERYPALAAIPNDWAQVQDSHWLDPEGCVFSCNVLHGTEATLTNGSWGGANALSYYAEITQNLEADPLFVDEAALDMHLRPESPVNDLACFQPIPIDLIGIIEPENIFTQKVYLPLILR